MPITVPTRHALKDSLVPMADLIAFAALALAVVALAVGAVLGFLALRLKRENNSLIDALAEDDAEDPDAWRRDVL